MQFADSPLPILSIASSAALVFASAGAEFAASRVGQFGPDDLRRVRAWSLWGDLFLARVG